MMMALRLNRSAIFYREPFGWARLSNPCSLAIILRCGRKDVRAVPALANAVGDVPNSIKAARLGHDDASQAADHPVQLLNIFGRGGECFSDR